VQNRPRGQCGAACGDAARLLVVQAGKECLGWRVRVLGDATERLLDRWCLAGKLQEQFGWAGRVGGDSRGEQAGDRRLQVVVDPQAASLSDATTIRLESAEACGDPDSLVSAKLLLSCPVSRMYRFLMVKTSAVST